MERKIVFINQATGYITIDILNQFAREFSRVDLITGSIRVQETPLDNRVRVSKIVRYDRGNNFRKALSWFIGTIQIFVLLKTKYRGYEKVLFTIPPAAYLLSPFFRPPVSLIIWDLYPDALKAAAIGEDRLIYRFWATWNKKLFGRFHRIFTLSSNLKSLILSYCPGARVHVIPNWSAFSGYTPVRRGENKFVVRNDIHEKFLVQYSGNIGVTHNVETLVETAFMLRNVNEIFFRIIGRGERSAFIRDIISERALYNCELLPFRKDEELYESLCAADISVIMLDNKTSDISVPSKTYNILAAGTPLIVIAPFNSEIALLVEKFNAGKAFEKDDLKGICDFILALKNDRALHRRLSDNAFRASCDFTSSNAERYLEYYS